MALLKEDGSLDIERINNLPHDEYVHMIARLTKEQRKEYYSKLPLNESNQPIQPIVVSSVDEFLNRGGWVDAEEFLKKLFEKHEKKQ